MLNQNIQYMVCSTSDVLLHRDYINYFTVHDCDSNWVETVFVSGCFGIIQCSVVPNRGEKFKQVVSKVREVSVCVCIDHLLRMY